jgi:hypothetical protein
MGNPFSVFSDDPGQMPGQGLARPDNYKSRIADRDYQTLLTSYYSGLNPALQAERDYGNKFASARLGTLDTTLRGDDQQEGVAALYLQALREADPEAAALMDSLMASASEELALDNQLDPNQTRLVEQAGRASAAARGMGFGPSDAFAETLAKLGVGEQMRDKRRSNALTLAQLRTALAARPADMATSASLSTNPNMTSSEALFGLLNNVYSENQANNRTQAGLETQIGMHQAETWNNWMKTATAASAGGGGAWSGGGVSTGGGGGGGGSISSI